MSNIAYLGKNVATIHSMPMGGYGYNIGKQDLKTFCNFIKKQPFKYLTAITANKYQQEIRKVLKENGFKSRVTFKSSHGGDETLTLWTKVQKNKKNIPSSKPINNPGYNCSVNYGKPEGRNFCLLAKSIRDTKTTLEGLKRVDNTPICYIVKNNSLIKDNGKKLKYIKNKMKDFKMVGFNY